MSAVEVMSYAIFYLLIGAIVSDPRDPLWYWPIPSLLSLVVKVLSLVRRCVYAVHDEVLWWRIRREVRRRRPTMRVIRRKR